MSKGVTPRSQDYARWYTDVVLKAELADYGPVRGTMVIRPYGYAIWELLQAALDSRFKATGHVNAYFPLLIPKSFLSKEAEHVEGFAKECAVVTHHRLRASADGGLEVDPDAKLDEELIIRPTSETVIWAMYKRWINSYRDLPLLINQWANIIRWELRTRLFLRTTEFLWQEGHTAHASEAEAVEETLRILDIYKDVIETELALPVIKGVKSESEKFAGAVDTYTIEAMMGDKRALQAGTSHYLGQNFAKAFDVTFRNQRNEEEYVYATSWGVTTRLVGAIVMAHGDDRGLRLPPRIAPYQVVIVPIYKDDTRALVLEEATRIRDSISDNGTRVHLDARDTVSPGFKFSDWEMKGAPLRVEIGPRDVAQNSAVLVRRDSGEKQNIASANIATFIPPLLDKIQTALFQQALDFREANTHRPQNWAALKTIMEQGGFARCGWDGNSETEAAIQEETKATIRVIPDNQDPSGLKCIHSGKPAQYEVILAKAY